ncbi:2TM domain-containing protein [Aequorivita sp. F47161]|uniref:2TM domain-containing protein n=1 Tax=Aequorivita vitellina TaxID=2874475 RepID=A0A9X1U2J8_9FLAO|nr:2TM domain-containing protein [Aequorivita vitellina]MCG2418307.1 2TM domain-containing protein [Aequorivita vitellina]MCZ4319402.1 2TM domain-containing protein [Aequorivita viscosa]
MRILKDFLKAFSVGSLVFIILGVIQYANGYEFTSVRELLIMFLYNQLYAVVLYMANAYYFGFLLEKFPNQVFKTKNLLKGIVGGIFVTLLGIFFIRIITEVLIEGRSFSEFLAAEKVAYYYISFIISVVVTAAFYTYYYYRNKQQSIVTAQKIIAGTASAKFDALKNQLDPHFLFNSLNVLTSLIEENPEAATRFTTSLSKVYRYVLEQKSKELVTLEEELNFAKLYMSLLAVRFEDSIVFTMPEKLENPQAKVVPLSLQLLLENAVKHNQVMPSKKLYITISEENGSLIVTNNRQPKQVLKESTGVGLRNIRDRYSLLTERPVAIKNTQREFRISIPILGENIKIMNTSQTFISEKKYRLAKKRVEKLKGFYLHLTIYLLFVPVFIYLNYISRAGFPWAIFPIVGWGMGVTGHAAETFDYNPFFGKNWEERKIRELMDKDE